jgi:hypothetical protein
MNGPLDQVANKLDEAVQGGDFEEAYGRQATSFLAALPALFRLYRRIPYDSEIPLASRRRAASVALYISESHDFLVDGSVQGLIDDVWIAYAALGTLIEEVGVEAVERHWRSAAPFEAITGLAENVDTLAEHVPVKVLEKMKMYLGLS